MSWLKKVKKLNEKTIKELNFIEKGSIIKVKIFDFNGELLGLRTRNTAKENSHFIQAEGCPLYPFNYINIDHKKPLIICEGETSCATVFQLIDKNVIATPGTTWKEEWTKYFKDIPKILITPDNDKAGLRLANKISFEFMAINIPCKIITVPKKYKDISDYYLKTSTRNVQNHWRIKTKKKGLLTKKELKAKSPYIFGFTDFIEYGKSIGDMPLSFLKGLALVALSTILSPKLDWRGTSIMSDLKPNLAVILAADSTRARKTESLKILLKLILDLDENWLIPQYFSPEALISIMSEREGKSSLLIKDEWGRYQASIKNKKYMKGIEDLFIHLLDRIFFNKALKSERLTTIKDPYLSIASAGTIESFVNSLGIEDLKSGYISRFLFIAPQKLRPIKPLTELCDVSKLYKNLFTKFQIIEENSKTEILINDVPTFKTKGQESNVLQTTPPFIVKFENKETLKRFDKFKIQMEKLDDEYPTFSPVHSRLAWHTLRIAILFASANFFKEKPKKTTIYIDNKTLIYAIYISRDLLEYQKFMVHKIGGTEFEQIIEQVLLFLKKEDKSRSEIMRKFWWRSRQADEIRDTLLDRRLIEVYKGANRAEIWSCINI